MSDVTWTERAACAGDDPEVWFPKAAHSRDRGAYEPARRICDRCTVTLHCLTYALDNGETHGMWGGFTPDEREQIKRELAA